MNNSQEPRIQQLHFRKAAVLAGAVDLVDVLPEYRGMRPRWLVGSIEEWKAVPAIVLALLEKQWTSSRPEVVVGRVGAGHAVR